jgi:hypothetical protein
MLHYSVINRSSFWLRVFSNSKVNGAPYWGDDLPAYPWAWPTGTYMQQRLRTVRAGTGDIDLRIAPNEAVPLRHDSAATSQFMESGRGLMLH